eukprot:SAG11_NODE_36647_length_260_cov_1.273292_1_plen_34_part_01
MLQYKKLAKLEEAEAEKLGLDVSATAMCKPQPTG